MRSMALARNFCLVACTLACAAAAGQDRLVFHGSNGPGRGKRVVLISGDEEYRSEQMMPQLARILAERHGFDCTVLFAIDPKDGTINPVFTGNIPGLETLDSADLVILFTRFRDLPDTQMKHFVDYVDSRRPIVGIRTATHAFDLKTSPTYRRFSWNSKEWDGGFGRQVLGETWINHHGRHGVQSTRGVIAPGQESHPILRGIESGGIWVPTDVYKVRLPLPEDVRPLILGEVLTGMKASDPPATGSCERPDDAGGVDQDCEWQAGLCDHHGIGSGPFERGLPPAAGECQLLGGRDGAAYSGAGGCPAGWAVQPPALRFWRLRQRPETG